MQDQQASTATHDEFLSVAELATELAYPVLRLPLDLRREGAFADAGGVGLDDAKDEIHRRWAKTRARRRHARQRVGRGDIGVGPEIHVKERALRAFEQDALARAAGFGQHLPDGFGIGQDFRRDLQQLRLQRGGVDGIKAEARPQRVVMRQQAADAQVQRRLVREVGHADGAAAHLVFIGRADAAPGGADLGHADLPFPRAVKFTMDGQDERGVFRNQQVVGVHLDALPAQLVDFRQQRPRVQHHAVADDRQFAAAHDARRQKRKLVDIAVDDQRVARIVATLEAGDDIGTLRQPVDDLALALIAPLGAHDHHVCHRDCPFPVR